MCVYSGCGCNDRVRLERCDAAAPYLVAVVFQVEVHVCPEEDLVHGREHGLFQLSNKAAHGQIVLK